MKKSGFFALLLILILLTGCGSSDTEYKTDVALSDLAEAVDAVIDSDSLVAMDDSYLVNAMQLDPENFADYMVKINATGVNIDEYGIFKAQDDESVDSVKAAAEGYLQLRLDNWMPEYMPEELPKLENAQVKVCGRYVMYAILSDEQSQAAFSAFEATLQS
ncbi:MAG: DUF4358 domain-containing protein [Oscillospiraceae bacterium]